MTDLAPDSPTSPNSQRGFLISAFEDTEATIRATDTKASIALVVHGFIFASLVGVLSRLGDGFDQACGNFRAGVIGLIALATLAFLGSIIQLLRCVMPAPRSTVPDPPGFELFFLPAEASKLKGTVKGMAPFDVVNGRLEALSDADINAELAAELYKVSGIRARKTALARLGFELLGVEIGLCLILLTCLGIYHL
jgi:hypothetical protein